MRRLALRCVLSQKVRDGKLILVDNLNLTDARTKSMVQILKALDIQGSTLIVTKEGERNVVISARNLPKVWTLPARLLNAAELLKRNIVVITLEAARKAEELWASGAASAEEAPKVEEAPSVQEAEVPTTPVHEAEASATSIDEAEVIDAPADEAKDDTLPIDETEVLDTPADDQESRKEA